MTRNAFITALGCSVVALFSGTAASAAGSSSVLVAKGTGTLTLSVGGGTVFGQLRAEGSSISIIDLSPAKDAVVTTSVLPSVDTATGAQTFQQGPGKRSLPFQVTGTWYVLTVRGTSNTNGVGVYGRVQAIGAGWLSIDKGVRQGWRGRIVKLATPPAELRGLRVPVPPQVQ